MWLYQLFLRIWNKATGKQQGLSEVQGNRGGQSEFDNILKRNTDMETEHGRCSTRRTIERKTGRLWSEKEIKGRLGRLLSKQPSRTREDEEVQRRQEEKHKRDTLIARLNRDEGFAVIKKVLIAIESDAYMNLRYPEKAKDIKVVEGSNGQPRYMNDWVSLDYFIGRQDGRIETIEDIRNIISEAITSIEKTKMKEEQDETAN